MGYKALADVQGNAGKCLFVLAVAAQVLTTLLLGAYIRQCRYGGGVGTY